MTLLDRVIQPMQNKESNLLKEGYVYILKLRDDTHYCGITKDIVKRITQHYTGKSISTRNKLPAVIKYIKRVTDMKEARKFEVRIKKQGVTRWYNKNNQNPDNMVITRIIGNTAP